MEKFNQARLSEKLINLNNAAFKEKERLAALGFNHFFKIGPKSIIQLLNYFGSLSQAYCGDFENLKYAGIKEDVIYAFLKFRQEFSLKETLARLEKNKINFVYLEEDSYPKILKEIYDPPFLLYYRGNINFNNKRGLAIIGSRKHSAYGEKLINFLLNSISQANLVIISGLAYGIDALAHQEALKNNLKTIAVLGTGLEDDDFYPLENLKLSQAIVASDGALISEFPPGTKALKQNFPLRNRIISGLSRAVLVIEAKERSGSSITVDQALDQGREVMAIPGNIFSEFSSGTNKLISEGAHLIKDGADILEFFINQNLIDESSEKFLNKEFLNKEGLNKCKNKKIRFENEEEELIYYLIKKANEKIENIKLEEISEITKLDTATINSTLSILEIKSLIKKGYNGYNLS